ncbi:MAG: tetratricopeptide repeat protein, partial [Verrucomicrobiales bacterium]
MKDGSDERDELCGAIEPDLAARVLSLIHGEASDFEREELERLLAERPELAAWKARLEGVDGLLREEAAGEGEEWRLSAERRESVLAAFHERAEEERREQGAGRAQRRVLWSLAACFVVSLILFGLSTPLVLEARKEGPGSNAVAEAEGLLRKGRADYAAGDYAGAEEKFAEGQKNLPKNARGSELERVLEAHERDAQVAGAGKLRREGRYEEARELLDEVLKADPGDAKAMEQLATLDDPIRTNPSLEGKDVEKGDEIRRNFYRGEGFYNSGNYDQAQEEFRKVLRIDPHNKAARRWLERTNDVKADGYRADYDETRSRLLAEVDKAWEVEVPPLASEPSAAPPSPMTQPMAPAPGDAWALVKRAPEAPASRMAKPAASLPGQKKEEAKKLRAAASPADKPVPVPMPEVARREAGAGDYGDGEGFSDPFAGFDGTPEQNLVEKRLRNEKIPRIDLKDVTLEQAIDFLNQRGRELDRAEAQGQLRIEVQELPAELEESKFAEESGLGMAPNLSKVKIQSLQLEDASVAEVLQHMADATKSRYQIDESGKVTFLPLFSVEEDPLVARVFPLSPEQLVTLRELSLAHRNDGSAPAETTEAESEKNLTEGGVQEFLAMIGVRFGEGSSASWLAEEGKLLVRNTPTNLNLIEAILDQVNRERQLEQGEISAAQTPESTFSLNVSE